MPGRSKFTAYRRAMVLQLLAAGASRTRAARAARIDDATLGRWLRRGRTAARGGRWRTFYEDVIQAEAEHGLRGLPPEPTVDEAVQHLLEEVSWEAIEPEPWPAIIQLEFKDDP